MVSTILDSSKIESLRNLDLNLKCSTNQKCLISAAIFVINLEDLCYAIETLRDIVSQGNIVISIVIRRVFKLGLSNWLLKGFSVRMVGNQRMHFFRISIKLFSNHLKLGWIPINFKVFIFKPNFWEKTIKMIRLVNYGILTDSPYLWISWFTCFPIMAIFVKNLKNHI